MLESIAEVVQAGALSQTLRGSIWLYPLVNTTHIVGIALLFGAIVPLDLRLLGRWRTVPLADLSRVLVPMAMIGLLLAIGSGALLFATRPVDYVAEPLFLFKFTMLVVAIANALALRRASSWRLLSVAHSAERAIPARWRAAAALSIVLWLGVIAVGRLIAYR